MPNSNLIVLPYSGLLVSEDGHAFGLGLLESKNDENTFPGNLPCGDAKVLANHGIFLV